MRRTLSLVAASAALVLTGATGAMAQAASPAPHQGGVHDKQAWRDAMKARMEAHERQRAQDLRTVLHLRPDQEAALTAFLAHPQRGDMKKSGMKRDGAAGEAMTTPQRLDEMAQREARMTAMRQQRADKVKTFYAALNPEQRQVFDALTRLQRQRGHGGPHGMGGMHGHGGPGGWGGPQGGRPGR
jgi:hypothetical protein